MAGRKRILEIAGSSGRGYLSHESGWLMMQHIMCRGGGEQLLEVSHMLFFWGGGIRLRLINNALG